jgi:hypothetical protein
MAIKHRLCLGTVALECCSRIQQDYLLITLCIDLCDHWKRPKNQYFAPASIAIAHAVTPVEFLESDALASIRDECSF